MEKDFSEASLLDFLDYVSKQSLVPKATAQARKSACVRILGVLEPHEKKDVRKINFEDVFNRFEIRHARDMDPQSLVTYKSRGKKAIDDFIAWKENPSGFKAQKPRILKRKQKEESQVSPLTTTSNTNISASSSTQEIRLLIRENVLVQVSNLPFNLTKIEADRIKKIIDAHVS